MSIAPHNEPAQHFESLKRVGDSGEYWLARDLQVALGYAGWRDFTNAIDRAKAACASSGGDLTSNFVEVGKALGGGLGVTDYRLSRYGCYLVAMNGDSRKSEIAAAQTYFAVRTRQAELGVPQPRGELLPLDVLRAAIDHIEDVRRAANSAQRTADETQVLGEENSARLDAIEGKHGWFAAVGYARLHGLPTSLPYLQRLGKAATAVAVNAGITPAKVQHQLYGEVNSYPEQVWSEAAISMQATTS